MAEVHLRTQKGTYGMKHYTLEVDEMLDWGVLCFVFVFFF